jgi:pimeloyl-ACP methyl ester carboxylesterase
MSIVESNGAQLVADERGEGETVLFVCGTGMPALMWEVFGRAGFDAAGFRTITFDNRGILPSSVPAPPYSMQDLVDDAIAVATALSDGPCHLVGASLGANIVATVIRQRPDLVRSAVMLCGGGNFRPEAKEVALSSLRAFTAGGDVARQAQSEGLLDAILTPDQRHDPEAQAVAALMLAGLSNASEDWTGSIGQTAANLEWAERDHLAEAAEISVPSLMIANEFDVVFDPADLLAASRQMQNCEFVLLEGQPHVATDPAIVERLVQTAVEFVARHRGQ